MRWNTSKETLVARDTVRLIQPTNNDTLLQYTPHHWQEISTLMLRDILMYKTFACTLPCMTSAETAFAKGCPWHNTGARFAEAISSSPYFGWLSPSIFCVAILCTELLRLFFTPGSHPPFYITRVSSTSGCCNYILHLLCCTIMLTPTVNRFPTGILVVVVLVGTHIIA